MCHWARGWLLLLLLLLLLPPFETAVEM